jgi:purine-nucleoside phosphorylase
MDIDKLRETASWLREKFQSKPQIGIVLGSGLGAFAQKIEEEISFNFAEIPNFALPSVEGHGGRLIIGSIDNKPIIALQGRVHFYEGHSMEAVVFPIRVLALLGVQNLILTNSAGGLGDSMQSGDFMIIEDHINLMGINPLIGQNIKEFGPRFPDMTEAYDRPLREKLENAFLAEGVTYHKGVYGGLSGPTYETPAEVRYLKLIGCSAVGMSTVPESIAANHMGLRVVAVSCITNLAAGIAKHRLTHSEVTLTAKKVEHQFSAFLCRFIKEL